MNTCFCIIFWDFQVHPIGNSAREMYHAGWFDELAEYAWRSLFITWRSLLTPCTCLICDTCHIAVVMFLVIWELWTCTLLRLWMHCFFERYLKTLSIKPSKLFSLLIFCQLLIIQWSWSACFSHFVSLRPVSSCLIFWTMLHLLCCANSLEWTLERSLQLANSSFSRVKCELSACPLSWRIFKLFYPVLKPASSCNFCCLYNRFPHKFQASSTTWPQILTSLVLKLTTLVLVDEIWFSTGE